MDPAHPHVPEASQPTRKPAGEEPDPSLVEELVRALSTAVRSHRLYGADSPMLGRFVATLREKLAELWAVAPELVLTIEERQIRWSGHPVSMSGGEGEGDLAFLFYKDGIRELTFLPGFEDEVATFLAVVARAPQLRGEEDDLTTLLWQEDLASLRYRFVEPVQEGVELPTGGNGEPPRPVSPEAVRAAAAEPTTGYKPEDFQETLYFLDEAELRSLAEEVRREVSRDLWADVAAALFDRLEDGDAERQRRIVHALGEILPALLAGGQFTRAAALLEELVGVASRPGVLSAPVLRELRGLFGQLASGETIGQLAYTLEDNPDALRSDSLAALLSFFPPDSLAALMRAAEAVTRPDVRRLFEQAIERLAAAHREEVIRLLGSEDADVVAGALRWVARLGIGSAVGEISRMLGHPHPAVRLAALEALQELRAAAAARAIVPLLEDESREVRVSAAKALGALEYVAARPALEEAINSKRLRAADRSEKVAFFEAFGRLAGSEGIAVLDRILNAKGWLGRGESPEIRACAALGLGRSRSAAARAALTNAAQDADPVVRSAVARALREEGA